MFRRILVAAVSLLLLGGLARADGFAKVQLNLTYEDLGVLRDDVTQPAEFVVQVYSEATPQSFTNFFQYVSGGEWLNSMVHRIEVPEAGVHDMSLVQLGGVTWNGPGLGYDSGANSLYLTGTTSIGLVDTAYGNVPLEASLSNVYGTIGMARTAEPDSATSQWYINTGDNLGFDPDPAASFPGYTVFGRVISGMDVLTNLGVLNLGQVDLGGLVPQPADENDPSQVDDYWKAVGASGEVPLFHKQDGLYYPACVTEAVELELSPGDANLDGEVNLLDLAILADAYGTTSRCEWTDADFNGDWVADDADLEAMALHWGLSEGGAMVPEPVTVLLLSAGSLWLIRRKRS
jgi:cyclophilin family peptidyl-prolyl cis-trans isomerase